MKIYKDTNGLHISNGVTRVEVSWDGFKLRNWDNNEVFYADPDTGNLTLDGTIFARKLYIGNVSNNDISNNVDIVLKSDNNIKINALNEIEIGIVNNNIFNAGLILSNDKVELKGGEIRLNTLNNYSSVQLTDKNISMLAKGSFLQLEGTVGVESEDGMIDNSYIRFSEKTGENTYGYDDTTAIDGYSIKTDSGFFNSLMLNNNPVISGNGKYQIVVSQTQPTGHNILWIQPQVLMGNNIDAQEETQSSSILITTNLINMEITEGNSDSFLITATGAEQCIWKYSADNGDTWREVSGGTVNSNTYTLLITNVTMSMNNYKYKCVLSNQNETKQSLIATLTVIKNESENSLTITTQPQNITDAVINKKIFFSIEASGPHTISYQWYRSKDEGITWDKIKSTSTTFFGADTPELSFIMKSDREIDRFKCTVSDTVSTYTSDIVKANVAASITGEIRIIKAPVNVEAKENKLVTFSVEAINVQNYQWQVQPADSNSWTNILSNNDIFSGAQTSELSFTMEAERVGEKYRCHLSNSDPRSIDTASASVTLSQTESSSTTTQIKSESTYLVSNLNNGVLPINSSSPGQFVSPNNSVSLVNNTQIQIDIEIPIKVYANGVEYTGNETLFGANSVSITLMQLSPSNGEKYFPEEQLILKNTEAISKNNKILKFSKTLDIEASSNNIYKLGVDNKNVNFYLSNTKINIRSSGSTTESAGGYGTIINYILKYNTEEIPKLKLTYLTAGEQQQIEVIPTIPSYECWIKYIP